MRASREASLPAGADIADAAAGEPDCLLKASFSWTAVLRVVQLRIDNVWLLK